jgi:hypothetical protein
MWSKLVEQTEIRKLPAASTTAAPNPGRPMLHPIIHLDPVAQHAVNTALQAAGSWTKQPMHALLSNYTSHRPCPGNTLRCS